MIVLDKSRQKAIHNRTIDTFIYEGSTGDTIVVEGMFKDRRFLDSHDPSGAVRPPYTVHHMMIRMEIKVPEMTIEAIEVEMPAVPRGDCREVKACLAPVKGMRIAGGFLAQVRRLVPRKDACTHLHELMAAMAPAAFQGAWSYRISRPIDPITFNGMRQGLKNSCYAWREGGPLAAELIDSDTADDPSGE